MENPAQFCVKNNIPDIPLNTNGSENDIRAFVTKRKISGGKAVDGEFVEVRWSGGSETYRLHASILFLARRGPYGS